MRGGRSVLFAVAIGCTLRCVEPRTEVIVRVSTDIPWGPGAPLQSVLLRIRRGDAAQVVQERETALDPGAGSRTMPLHVGVLPAGDDLTAPLWIEALGCRELGRCADPLVRQRAVVSFERGRTREVELALRAACRAAPCGVDQLCTAAGQCAPATQAPTRDFVAFRPPMPIDAAWPDAPAGDIAAEDARDAGAADARDAISLDAGDAPTARCPSGMLFVPGGRFIMGSTDSDASLPLHGVELAAFCIDETEVTVDAYRGCVDRRLCRAPVELPACNWYHPDRGNHPMNCTTWSMARDFCDWRSGYLPTEAQWEYAARGTDSRRYPWGDGRLDEYACTARSTTTTPYRNTTCPVGYFDAGRSPFGAVDMVGNVMEWTFDAYMPYSGDTTGVPRRDPRFPGVASGLPAVVRGGSISGAGVTLTTTWRDSVPPNNDTPGRGFRCASSPR